MASPRVEESIRSLLAVLDGDIAHVRTVLQRLDQLRSLLVKRDNTGLEKLLTELTSEAETYVANERKRQDLRQELAGEMQCGLEQVTLSRLVSSVPEAQRSELAERQKTLKSLTSRLKREHELTRLLIGDCARLNRLLLQVFCRQNGRGKMNYGVTGAVARPPEAVLMSLHF
jgi:hypothetical protein